MPDRVRRQFPLESTNPFQDNDVFGPIEFRDLDHGDALGIGHNLGERRRHIDVGLRRSRQTKQRQD